VQARAESVLDRGQALAEQGDLAGAMAAYQDAVRARPAWGEAHARLGGMQLVNQHYPDAVRSFQQAISLGVADSQPFVGMAMAYLHMGQYGPARAALNEAKARGAAGSQDIDRILTWLDAREPQPAPTHP
jgi:tetratricopeptide (TPR) repeat protein